MLAIFCPESCLTWITLDLCRAVVAAAESNATVIASIGAMHQVVNAGPTSTTVPEAKEKPPEDNPPSESCSADQRAVGSESSAPDVSEADALSADEDTYDNDEDRDRNTRSGEPLGFGGGILRPRPRQRLEQRIELIVPSHAEPWVVAQVLANGPQALLIQLASELTAHSQLGSNDVVDSSKQCAWQPGVKSEGADANV